MPDAQGVASFIGEFMKGYMGQVAQMEQDKVRKAASLMDVADQYRRMMEEAPTEEGYYSAQEVYQQKISEADKLMNQKVSGLGTIMGLLGFGKKGKGGQTTPIPREWAEKPGQAPGPAPMPRPAAMGPEPSDIENPNIPVEFRGMQQFMGTPAAAPVAAAAPAAAPAEAQNNYAGLPWVMQQKLRIQEEQRSRERKEALEQGTQLAEINRRFGREDYTWKQEQERLERKQQADAYRASPEFGKDPEEDARILRDIEYGISYREPALRTSTSITRNKDGQLVRRTVDLRTQQVLSEEPYYQSGDEPLIQAIIQEAASKNKVMTPEQAQTELGRRRLEAVDLANKAKNLGIANQAALLAARNTREEMQKKALAGGLTAKDARQLYQSAMTYAKSVVLSREENADKTDAEIIQAAIPIARQWIEEANLSWQKIQSLISGQPERTPQQELNGFVPAPARQGSSTGKAGIYNFTK